MSIGRPKRPIVLLTAEYLQLKSVASSRSMPSGLVQRAKLVLMAAEGVSNTDHCPRAQAEPAVGL